MKRLYLFFACIATIVFHVQAQPTNQNYVRSRTMTNNAASTYLENIQYYDDFGRPFQLVQKGITPGQTNLVSLQEYGIDSRETKSWLPIETSSIYLAPATFKSQAPGKYGGDSRPFSEPDYENSPLNRVTSQKGPGQSWENKPVTIAYLTNKNSAGDSLNCIYYKVTDSSTDTIITITRPGNYAAKELHVTRLADEDGNTTFEFKNKLGQTLLTRQVIKNGNNRVLHDTYYIYDGFGNLKAVLPPMASNAMKTGTSWASNSVATIKDYVYFYRYDDRNRCVVKKLPGASCIRYIYDNGDRLIFSQNGEQRLKGEWMFTLPDMLGRIVLTGLCKKANSTNIAASLCANKIVKAEFNVNGTVNGYNIKLNTAALTLNSLRVLTVNYYDDYAFYNITGFPSYQYLTPPFGFDARHVNSKGLLTGTITSEAGGGTTKLYSVMFYDKRGLLVQSQSSNHMGGKETVYFKYNFAGQPEKKQHVHAPSRGDNQTEDYTYTYDHAGRLTETKHKLTSGTVAGAQYSIAKNTYDNLGRVSVNAKHNATNLTSTYTYNIRSWLKTITCPYFTESLYHEDSYLNHTPRYNGNISAMTWKSGKETILRGYKFTYDNLNRMLNATYGEGASFANSVNRFDEKVTEYDMNGNIKKMERRGKTNTSYGVIDNLTFEHTGNQLKKITDSATDPTFEGTFNFLDPVNESTEYKYNTNGSLVQDRNKRITAVRYNSLNLPDTIQFTNGNTIIYLYYADGIKRSATYITAVDNITVPMGSIMPLTSSQILFRNKVEYCGNKIYDTLKLSMILFDGGYISVSGSTYTYHYYLKDHLGNNRVVAKATGDPVQVNHYYPFGGLFGVGVDTSNQRYKYGGKELDRMHGVDWYDFEARMLDSKGGGFTTMDPLAEKYYSWSPYAYCLGNPVNAVDLKGDSTTVLNLKNGQHMGLLIQNDAGKWQYYSVNGDNVYASGKHTGGREWNDIELGEWDTPQEFMNSFYNQSGDKNDKTINSYGYEEGYIIPTTPKQDNIIRTTFSNISKNEEYSLNPLNPNHCATAIQKSLNNAGINTSESYYIPSGLPNSGQWINRNPYLPSQAFKAIIKNNPSGKYIHK